VSDVERDKLHAVIKRQFGLDDATTDELVAEATEAEHEAIDLYHFTSVINRSLDEEGRRRVVEMMWEIVYADGGAGAFESNLDLARGRPPRHFIARAHRARSARCEAAGGRGGVTQETRAVTLITGASAGIGAALAHEFAAHGHEVVLIARREQALAALADAIAAKGAPRPTVLCQDVARPDAAQAIAEALAQHGLEPDVVVNNAGFGLLGSADKLDRTEQLAMIDLNVRALTDLSLAFIDSLKRRRGGILNVASGRRLHARPRHGGLLRDQGLCALLQRGAASRAQRCGRAGDRAVPGAGADRVSGARRDRRRLVFAAAQTLRPASGTGRLSRAQGGPSGGRSGLRQSRGDGACPVHAPQHAIPRHGRLPQGTPLMPRSFDS
jgi:hypothetical protein